MLDAFLQGMQYSTIWNDKHMGPKGRESVTQDDENKLGSYRIQNERDTFQLGKILSDPKDSIYYLSLS